MRLNLIISACAALAGLSAEPIAPSDEGAVGRRVAAMGTELTVAVEAADRASALRASEEVVRAVEAVEARLSTWRPQSELSRLNATPVGERFPMSEALADDLEVARRCWRLSGGAFDPGVGAILDAWRLRESGRVPDSVELGRAVSSSGIRLLHVREGSAVRLQEGLRIEEGAFGKGLGLDAAIDRLRELGVHRAELDLGGQVSLLGTGDDFRVDLADPRERERRIAELRVDAGSVATSGNSERGLVVDGVTYGHLFDPRSGRPVADFGSVTVWAATGVEADAYSTALYVMGPDEGLAWASEQPGVEALFVEAPESGPLRIRASAGWEGRIETRDETITIEVGRPE